MSGSALYETFARAPLAFERGEGSWLIEASGARYLDFAGGIAVNSLGHGHPHLVAALKDQADKLWHVSNLYRVPGQERLAERLAAATFADKVFFTNSGAEALECAIKTARRYQFANGHPERFRIITFEGAFHGRTLARAVPTEKLRRLRELCDKNGLLLVFDEVQCGIGRTGKLFAYEWSGIVPDVMAIAKGIGGGFPVGACLATDEAAKGMVSGVHGTTFGGNPLAMAVGNAVLDVVLEDGFLDEVKRKALVFKQGLAGIVDEFPDVFEEVRGVGLMLGLKCKMPNGTVNAAFRSHNFLAVPAGENVIRLLPPLNVSDEEIRIALDAIRASAASLSTAAGAA